MIDSHAIIDMSGGAGNTPDAANLLGRSAMFSIASVRRFTPIFKFCASCGTAFRVKRSHFHLKTYCSNACMSQDYKTRLKGKANPHFKNADARICSHCGTSYRSYNKERKYCTHECYVSYQMEMGMRRNRVDNNQKAIVEALIGVGASVLDTTMIGQGMPDLIVGFRGSNFLLEVKNPENRYGKAGLSKKQQAWQDKWPAPVHIVYTVDDALRAIGVLE